MKSIEKLPADRFDTAREFIEALEDEGFTYTAAPRTPGTGTAAVAPAMAGPAAAASTPWHRDLRLLAMGAVAVASLAFAFLRGGTAGAPDVPVTRAMVDLGSLDVASMDEVVISPDGSKFAVVGRTQDGAAHVYWRNAWEEVFRIIPGTQNARFADFSPDGDWIVFRQTNPEALMKVAVAGGAPVPIVPPGLQAPRDPHWGEDGTVVFAGPQGRGLYRVSANGGEPEVLVEGLVVREPYLLPGSRYVAAGTPQSELILFDLRGDSVIDLGRVGMDPAYVDTGHLLYVDPSGQLWAAPLDLDSGELGPGVPVQGGIYTFRGLFARYSVSRAGTAVFGFGGGPGDGSGGEEFVILDQDGELTPVALSPRDLSDPRWSPDGTEIVYVSRESEGDLPQVFTYDVVLGTAPRQVTLEGANFSPVWSPDGTRVAFSSFRDDVSDSDLFVKDLRNEDPPVRLAWPGGQDPVVWPADDTLVARSDGNLVVVDLTGDSAVFSPYLDTELDMGGGDADPLGEYVVYEERRENAPPQIFARRFPEPGQPVPISDGFGISPVWAPSGEVVFFLSGGQRPGIVRVELARDPLRVLSRAETALPGTGFAFDLDLHPDGERFLLTRRATDAPVDEDLAAPMRHVLVVNWMQELRQRLGEGN